MVDGFAELLVVVVTVEYMDEFGGVNPDGNGLVRSMRSHMDSGLAGGVGRRG